jgi:dihydroorotate dehydrogenase electron transfer subunit
MRQMPAAVISNRLLARDTWEMEFGWNSDETPEAGQFLSLRASSSSDPLLRRPFAFSAFDRAAARASIIYLKRGRTTEILASLAPGAILDVLGPLGKGFTLPPPDGLSALLAGGIGAGPILFLARRLTDVGLPWALAFGARTKAMVPLERLPPGTLLRTDDGSLGKAGTAVEALDDMDGPARIYACGPGPMLAAAALAARARGIPCQVAVEQHMACGVGACMGCSVPLAAGGYARACADGPVFDAQILSWEAGRWT